MKKFLSTLNATNGQTEGDYLLYPSFRSSGAWNTRPRSWKLKIKQTKQLHVAITHFKTGNAAVLFFCTLHHRGMLLRHFWKNKSCYRLNNSHKSRTKRVTKSLFLTTKSC